MKPLLAAGVSGQQAVTQTCSCHLLSFLSVCYPQYTHAKAVESIYTAVLPLSCAEGALSPLYLLTFWNNTRILIANRRKGEILNAYANTNTAEHPPGDKSNLSCFVRANLRSMPLQNGVFLFCLRFGFKEGLLWLGI